MILFKGKNEDESLLSVLNIDICWQCLSALAFCDRTKLRNMVPGRQEEDKLSQCQPVLILNFIIPNKAKSFLLHNLHEEQKI